jgi:hypothetical protein
MTAIPFPRPVHSANTVEDHLGAVDERLATVDERLALLTIRIEQVLNHVVSLRERLDADAAGDPQ